jgi:hypothetical protein
MLLIIMGYMYVKRNDFKVDTDVNGVASVPISDPLKINITGASAIDK